MNNHYKRVYVGKIYIYADHIDAAKEMAMYIDNMDSDTTYCSIDSKKLEYNGRVKIAG